MSRVYVEVSIVRIKSAILFLDPDRYRDCVKSSDDRTSSVEPLVTFSSKIDIEFSRMFFF